MSDPHQGLSQYVQAEAPQLIGSLTRQLGNFHVAEDAVQDAIVEAVRRWPEAGVPREPGAWLRVTARRKATDRLRREAKIAGRLSVLAELQDIDADAVPPVADDRLVLLFMCCHPSLSREAQVALMLRCLLGLTTAQLAKAFLTSEGTMTKRIVRAKRKIVEASIPFALPSGGEAAARLGEVLTSIYGMFNEGYLSAGPDATDRADLAEDAEWLAGLVHHLLPDEPEVIGLLALIRLQHARRRARFNGADIVLLRDQDRALWDRPAIDRALELLNLALRKQHPGPYQVQAAIAGCHAVARSWEATDWSLIVTLYEQLVELTQSPIAELNRAIALSHRDGAAAALTAIAPLAERLDSYHLYHAARAEFLRELGRPAEAGRADRRATSLTSNPAEVQLLRERVLRDEAM